MDMHRLNHEQLVKGVSMGFRRYLFRKIKWDRRMIGILGTKGVGKTTLLLQRIKSAFGLSKEALYLSLDALWFQERCMLSDTVRGFYADGGRHLFLDNVHRYANWMEEVLTLYRACPDLQIVFAVPTLAGIERIGQFIGEKGDWYVLHTMSFREYLSYEGALEMKPVPLEQLLLDHKEVTRQVAGEINMESVFRNYLSHGCYPFYWEDPDAFAFRLQDMVRDMVDADLLPVHPMGNVMVHKMKLLLLQLGRMAPKVPTRKYLITEYHLDNSQIQKLLRYIEETEIFRFLSFGEEKARRLRSIYSFWANPNLMASFAGDMASLYAGETFFVDQMSNCGTLELLPTGDYRVNDTYTFMIGGMETPYERIRNLENTFAAVCGQMESMDNRIPLWAFGLCY